MCGTVAETSFLIKTGKLDFQTFLSLTMYLPVILIKYSFVCTLACSLHLHNGIYQITANMSCKNSSTRLCKILFFPSKFCQGYQKLSAQDVQNSEYPDVLRNVLFVLALPINVLACYGIHLFKSGLMMTRGGPSAQREF